MGDLKHPEVLQLHGTKNSLNHILNCENGGYANYRHDNVRNAIAEYLRQICKDVTIEPNLIPIKAEKFQQKGNNADKARLAVSLDYTHARVGRPSRRSRR